MSDHIDGVVFSQMFASGTAAIGNTMQEVNELNVFPVPDGDTGTNMSMTMDAGLKKISEGYAHAGKAAAAAAQGLLRGARGNSGVILSLLFRGFGKSVKELETIDGLAFAMAMSEGVTTAYSAVMKPAEGTVLTVTRVSAQAALEYAMEDSDLERVMNKMLLEANAALKETVYQNPVLEKAGVVDAGAYGFCLILGGMLEALRGNPVLPTEEKGMTKTSAVFSAFSNEDIKFGYCTEFIIKRPRHDTKDPSPLRAFLESVGDSLVFVDDESIIKVHVHTDNPGRVLARALKHGELTAIKVENMREQHTEQVIRQNDTSPPAPVSASTNQLPPEPISDFGFVSVSAGAGLAAVLVDLGVNQVVEGGQTMNPSTQDILDKVKAVSAKTVFVLPNNKNIIMAAQQCIPLSEKQILVIPSKSVPQGIMAMLSFDPALSASDNQTAMTEALSQVVTVQVTTAARDSQFDGQDINEGDHMALLDGQLVLTNPSRKAVLEGITDKMLTKPMENITVYYGEGVEQSEAEETADMIQRRAPEATVMAFNGGQPIYSYIIAVE